MSKTVKFRHRLPDVIVLLLTTAVTLFCAAGIYGKNKPVLQFVIQGKEGKWIYPVNQTARLDAIGPLGNTVIELHNGTARVISSPCSNQTCVSSGVIQRRGQWIACLPNAVFIRVEAQGGKETEYAETDALAW